MKYQQLCKFTLLVLYLLAFTSQAAKTHSLRKNTQGVFDTCESFSFDANTNILTAYCQYGGLFNFNPWRSSSVNLDSCLENNDGAFKCGTNGIP